MTDGHATFLRNTETESTDRQKARLQIILLSRQEIR